MAFKIGQLLCLTCDIYEEAEDFPPGCLAHKGDVVEVAGISDMGTWDYSVRHPGRRGSFGVKENELLVKGNSDNVTEREVRHYEIAASWWAGLIWFRWGQNLAGRYFIWKSRRKWARYQRAPKIYHNELQRNQHDAPISH